MLAVSKESRSPLPTFSDDEVVNYLVTEAAVARFNAEMAEKRKEQEKKNWRKEHKKLPARQ